MTLPNIHAMRRGATALWCVITLALALVSQGAFAASVLQQNLMDLIEESNAIMIGTVTSVTDGFTEQGVPYTEVTMDVSESILGGGQDTYTFRQFGLMEPREIDGRTYLGTTPDGWPNWNARERVFVFLGSPARLTGLQTTVGLNQGKLRWANGKLANSENNAGMFKNMQVTATSLSSAETAMLQSEGQAIDAEAFVRLVRRAVNENWIARGEMRHANQ